MIVGSLQLKAYIFQPNKIILHLFLHISIIVQQFSSNIEDYYWWFETCQVVQICQLVEYTSWEMVIHMLAGW